MRQSALPGPTNSERRRARRVVRVACTLGGIISSTQTSASELRPEGSRQKLVRFPAGLGRTSSGVPRVALSSGHTGSVGGVPTPVQVASGVDVVEEAQHEKGHVDLWGRAYPIGPCSGCVVLWAIAREFLEKIGRGS